jgi:hypothetical protein
MNGNFISKKAISRRTMLGGVGATLALPFLDAMVPAMTAAVKPVSRLGVVYLPNGIVMEKWTPASEGAGFEFTPILKPLEPFRDHLVVVSGLNNLSTPGSFHGHPGASTKFLTTVPAKETRGTAELGAGISMDQIVAKEFRQHTQLASLEIGLEGSDSAGTCNNGYSCIYTSTTSWSSPTTPLPMQHDPRTVFERMFGDTSSTDPAVLRARRQEAGSILDSVTEELARLSRGLGADDNAKLKEYFEAIRDVERRIQKAEEQNARQTPAVDQPAGIPDDYEAHSMLMYDLYALAFQADLTRVVTFMIGRELTGQNYPQLGIADGHHPLSHHQNDPAKIEKLIKINFYHVSLFSRFIEKLRSTPDGDGSLLDHVILIYGSGMGNGNGHDPMNIPILLLGGGSGQIKGGQHLRFPKETPLENLHLTVMDKLGVHVEKISASARRLDGLSAL